MTEPPLADLLVKAVRALPQEEQDIILAGLLDRASAPRAASVLPRWAQGQTHAIPDIDLAQTHLTRLIDRGTNLRVVPVRLSVEQHDALKQWCESNDFSMATVIRGLVDRFLATQTRPE
jgi:hypothetical protein